MVRADRPMTFRLYHDKQVRTIFALIPITMSVSILSLNVLWLLYVASNETINLPAQILFRPLVKLQLKTSAKSLAFGSVSAEIERLILSHS